MGNPDAMTSERIQALRTLAATGAQGAKSAAITECLEEIERLQKRKAPPKGFTLAEVMEAAEKRKWKAGAAEAFFDHYEMVGWVYGRCRHPIRKLSAAMSTWERTAKNGSAPVEGKNSNAPPAGWPEFLKEKRYDFKGEFKHAPEYMRLEFATWKKGHSRTA